MDASEPVLRGERVTLRPLAEDDLPRLLEILLQPGIAEWWPSYDMPRLRADTMEDPNGTSLAIEYEGQFAGLVIVTEQPDPFYKSAGLDIALDASIVGQGLGGDALRTVIRHLFEDLGHHRITIDPSLANERAIRAYERVGFKRIGVARDYEKGSDGTFHNNLLMDMLAGELS